MEVLEKAEMFDSHANFQHSSIVFKEGDRIYEGVMATRVCHREHIDKSEVKEIKEVPHKVFPLYDQDLFGDVYTNPSDDNIFLKTPSLLGYNPSYIVEIPELMKSEAHAFRLLRESPHPNLAKYKGCIVKDNRVVAFCLEKYPHRLSRSKNKEWAKNIDRKVVMDNLRKAVAHLHSLGLCHNDINPNNIMFDGELNVVLIDFDSCGKEGDKLLKFGTPGWIDEELKISSKMNDFKSLDKLLTFIDSLLV